MWLAANVELVALIISLAVDTKLFVKFIFRGPLLLLTVVYACLAAAAVMAGPAKHANILQLYRLPQVFRFECEVFALGYTVFYLIFVSLTRYMLQRFSRHKVMPS